MELDKVHNAVHGFTCKLPRTDKVTAAFMLTTDSGQKFAIISSSYI